MFAVACRQARPSAQFIILGRASCSHFGGLSSSCARWAFWWDYSMDAGTCPCPATMTSYLLPVIPLQVIFQTFSQRQMSVSRVGLLSFVM